MSIGRHPSTLNHGLWTSNCRAWSPRNVEVLSRVDLDLESQWLRRRDLRTEYGVKKGRKGSRSGTEKTKESSRFAGNHPFSDGLGSVLKGLTDVLRLTSCSSDTSRPDRTCSSALRRRARRPFDSADRLGDDGGDGFVPERAGVLTGALDDGVELPVRQCLERAVDLLEARARRQDLPRASLPLHRGARCGPHSRRPRRRTGRSSLRRSPGAPPTS